MDGKSERTVIRTLPVSLPFTGETGLAKKKNNEVVKEITDELIRRKPITSFSVTLLLLIL